ncbi:phosphate regulon sensor histidine kinase PhoR [Curvibacter sp. APW13]|uniref:phosphate regulon sensor histidine kinase PhoR n=1 Tax=Curvibacter sp. APW13 TaxID=3077236 RepID=UPI0028DE8EBC|nr:phosphate regulon sensor histidine kinase PhoR [Curvibacter sp. APW13]MDT8992211.1 phosphate regulon sensor histidine kinase PhoR [Curvibacter sp. APW13]
MAARIVWLLVLQVLAVGLAWIFMPLQDRSWALLCAALGATYLWLAFDVVRSGRLLAWLKAAPPSPIPLGSGLWAEVQDRVWRALRQRDRALADSEQRLKDFLAALQASPNGVVLLNPQGQIEWLNDMAGQHFGLDRERDLMQHFANLVRDPAFARYYAQNVVGDGVLMPGKGHTPTHPVRLSVQMHEYGEGRRLLLSRDVTALEQAEAMRRDFVANVSHEIRTPLTVLSGFIETLQSLVLQEGERARYLGLMAEQAQRMQSLVSDLLTLSRLEGSPLPLSNEWVGVDALLAQCLRDANTLAELVGPREQPIAVDAEPGLELAGVQSELQSAMTNLLTNAVRYTPSDKEIQVHLRRLEDGGAEFCVRDRGVGIAQEHLSRLTERFYRVDRSRSRDTGGTGLGLAIVKHVVQRHGAELRITSTWGQGSAFAIRFPASRVRTIEQL